MGGILQALVAGLRTLLSTTITCGTDGVSNTGFNNGLFGSLGTATFTDATGNSRTVIIVQWTGATLQLALNGINVPDSDATFSSLYLAGPGGTVTLARSSRTSYNGTAGGSTYSLWTFSTAAVPGSSGQAVTFKVNA